MQHTMHTACTCNPWTQVRMLQFSITHLTSCIYLVDMKIPWSSSAPIRGEVSGRKTPATTCTCITILNHSIRQYTCTLVAKHRACDDTWQVIQLIQAVTLPTDSCMCDEWRSYHHSGIMSAHFASYLDISLATGMLMLLACSEPRCWFSTLQMPSAQASCMHWGIMA